MATSVQHTAKGDTALFDNQSSQCSLRVGNDFLLIQDILLDRTHHNLQECMGRPWRHIFKVSWYKAIPTIDLESIYLPHQIACSSPIYFSFSGRSQDTQKKDIHGLICTTTTDLYVTGNRRNAVMDPRNDKDNGLALTESASLYLEQRPRRRRRTRHDSCPILLLLAILSHLVFCGAAIAVSVLVVCYSLQETDETVLGLVARILFFVASCVGVVYVFMHVCAARETFVRSQGTSHLYGRFTVTVAILIMRLGLPLWASAVGTTAVVAKQKGLDLRLGIKGNFIWIQLAAAVLGL